MTSRSFDIARDERPSEAVVRGVAAVTDQSIHAIEPLFESVDPDALDALFAPFPDGTSRVSGRVVVHLEGCRVSVEGSRVQISDAEIGGRTG